MRDLILPKVIPLKGNKMKTITMLPILIMLFPLAAFTGEIYGTIKEENKPIGKGVEVVVKCGNETYPTQTKRYGSYSVYVPKKGRCTLTVHNRKIDVYSYQRSVRYDLVLERNRLKRK